MAPTLRDFLGTRCPRCTKDILQPPPASNRMPVTDKAWCPSCGSYLSLDDLTRRRGTSFLRRLLGDGNPGSA